MSPRSNAPASAVSRVLVSSMTRRLPSRFTANRRSPSLPSVDVDIELMFLPSIGRTCNRHRIRSSDFQNTVPMRSDSPGPAWLTPARWMYFLSPVVRSCTSRRCC